jgi:hypothetical protein
VYQNCLISLAVIPINLHKNDIKFRKNFFFSVGDTVTHITALDLAAHCQQYNILDILLDYGLGNKKKKSSHKDTILLSHTACVFDICLYLTPLGQARQFIETCGT